MADLLNKDVIVFDDFEYKMLNKILNPTIKPPSYILKDGIYISQEFLLTTGNIFWFRYKEECPCPENFNENFVGINTNTNIVNINTNNTNTNTTTNTNTNTNTNNNDTNTNTNNTNTNNNDNANTANTANTTTTTTINNIYDLTFFPESSVQIIRNFLTKFNPKVKVKDFEIFEKFIFFLLSTIWFDNLEFNVVNKTKYKLQYQQTESYLKPQTLLQKYTAIRMINILHHNNFQYLAYYRDELKIKICFYHKDQPHNRYIMRWLDGMLIRMFSYHIPLKRELNVLNPKEAITTLYENYYHCSNDKCKNRIQDLVFKHLIQPCKMCFSELEDIFDKYIEIAGKDKFLNEKNIFTRLLKYNIYRLIGENIIFFSCINGSINFKKFICFIYGEKKKDIQIVTNKLLLQTKILY